MKKSLYLLSILLIVGNARVARADTIDIFDISVGGSLDMCGVCNGPLVGTLTIDITKGVVLAADISAFDDELIQVIFSSPSGAGWELAVADEILVEGILINNRTLDFTFSTTNPGSLVGFNGGAITNGLLVDFFDGVVLEDQLQGTITFDTTLVPEPSSLVLVLTGVGLLAGKTRKWWVQAEKPGSWSQFAKARSSESGAFSGGTWTMKIFLCLLAVLFITLSARDARADTIDVFDISAVGSPVECFSCSAIGGELTINVTNGTIIAAVIFTCEDADCTSFDSFGPVGTGWVIDIYNWVPVNENSFVSTNSLTIFFTTTKPGSLVGFEGGTITDGTLTSPLDLVVLQDNIQGTITLEESFTTPVPEPSSLALVLTGLGLLAGKTRNWWLRR